MSRLSRAQQAVLDKMSEGWQLREGMSGISQGTWLQRTVNGLVETETVRSTTFYRLWKAKRVRVASERFPIRTYELAPA